MRKGILLLFFIACAPQLAYAQDSEGKTEIFGGYSYLITDTEGRDSEVLDRFGPLDGFNVSVTRYLTRRFGITGDFSAHFRSKTEEVPGGVARFKSRSFSYLAGPQVKFRNRTRATPFLRALAGVANNRINFEATATGSSTPAISQSLSFTDFALAFGGGLDVRVSSRIDLRVFQLDYNPVFVRARTGNFGVVDRQRFDNARFSIGVVFK